MDEEEVQIPDDIKETQLNQTPSNTEGVSDLEIPKQPNIKTNTDPNFKPVTTVNRNPDPIDGEDAEVLGEMDYNLPPEEFKNKYYNKPGKGASASGFQPGLGRTFQGRQQGKGIEDYKDYINNPVRGQSLDLLRALNQSNSEQLGHAVARIGFNILLK